MAEPSKKHGVVDDQSASEWPHRDVCVRALLPGPSFEARAEGAMPIMTGYLAVFDEWTEIKSAAEVPFPFMERISRGAFTKTLKENRSNLRVLFHHGMDPQIGFKPLGTIERLEEDERGVGYDVALFDTEYVRAILPALEAGQFGSSFTFRPTKDEVSVAPQRTTFNPKGLPEVTIQELRMSEFGPCMFPAYAGTSAGTRSMTDELIVERLQKDPLRLAQLLGAITGNPIALSTERAEVPHSQREEPQHTVAAVPVKNRFETREDYLEWLRSKS